MSQDRLSKLTKAQLIAKIEGLEQRCKALQQPNQSVPQISQFRDAIESLTGGIAYFDRDDRLVFCNENYRLARAGMEDFIKPGMRYIDFLRERPKRDAIDDDEARDESWIQERMKAHLNPGRPILRRLDDGRIIQLNEYKTKDGGIVLLRTDITEIKNTEENLRQAEERFHTLIDNAKQGILVHRNRVPLYANKALAELHGYNSPGEVLALESTRELMSQEHIQVYGDHHERRLRGEVITESEDVRAVYKNGNTFWVQRHSFVIDWGGVPAVCSIRTNIEDRKRSEAELLEAKLEAETLSRVKTDFLANISHELRTPLNAIIGFSGSLKAEIFGAVANEKQLEYIEDIHRSGEHLLDLINDIIDVSVIESGKLDLRIEDVEVIPLIESSLRLVRPRADNGGVKLLVNVGNVHAVRADERRLKQILVNLLANAVKFTLAGGQISVTCQLEDDGGIVFEIADTGIGMSKDEIRNAMEPFGQAESSLARKYEGTGLGLPLTDSLIKAHGGTLNIKSTPGKGTIVTFRMGSDRVISLREAS